MQTSLLAKLSVDLLLPKDSLDYLIRSAPHRYKVYQVPKRSGSGMRTIAQPAKEVKKLQYWVMENIFCNFNVHPSAIAYVTGKNIRTNAAPHANHPYALKLDFKDFFPSIKAEDFLQYAKENEKLQLQEADLRRLARILFWCPRSASEHRLSIGAPSSPYLSNAMMYKFDIDISQYCALQEVIYTRYADDMTFSMVDKTMRSRVLEKVLDVLRMLPFPKLEINSEKTVFCSKAHRRMVTGLILTNDGNVSLGRDRKRNIRAQLHYFVSGRLQDSLRPHLRGMLAFARDIEPAFIRRMEQRYGKNVISSI